MAVPPGGYFRCASPFWMGVVVLCISYFAWAVFLPSTIPYKNLGQLGYFTKYLVDNHHKLLYNGFWLAWGIHVAEALYSVKLCKAVELLCVLRIHQSKLFQTRAGRAFQGRTPSHYIRF